MITTRQFSPGELIVKENDPGETAFIIERGKVEVTKETGGGTAHIAFLETGATFGEMSMVDDFPRNASVRALEETLVREVHRDNLYATMKENPEAVIKFLKSIFERLREANMKLAQLEAPAPPQPAPPPQKIPVREAPQPVMEKAVLYSIEGMTPRAVEAMSDNPFRFSAFPIKIGRKSNDPLVSNHLEISDQDPLQISRHHVSLIREHGKIGVVDRGSQLGALVDGVRVGGKKHGPGPVFFNGNEGILVLGTDASPYRYKIKMVS
ncbi:MAG: family transcriptional regulator [Fibrobacteres bacterium]|nr:family transcriptional regulator [Fibrobacterota bacterium]